MRITSGIFNSIIQRVLCVTLILLLIHSPFATAVEIPSDCKDSCCMKPFVTDHGITVDSKLTAFAFGCCFSSQNHLCGFEKSSNVDISRMVMLSAKINQPDVQGFITITNTPYLESPAKKSFGDQLHSSALPRQAPIYLYNLSLLC